MFRICIDEFVEYAVKATGCSYYDALAFIEAEYEFLHSIGFATDKKFEAEDGYLEEVYYTPEVLDDRINVFKLKLYVSVHAKLSLELVDQLMYEENNYGLHGNQEDPGGDQ